MTAENSSRQLELYKEPMDAPELSNAPLGSTRRTVDSRQVLPGDFITSVHHEVHGGASTRAAGPLTFPPRRPIPEIPATIPSGLLAAWGLGASAGSSRSNHPVWMDFRCSRGCPASQRS